MAITIIKAIASKDSYQDSDIMIEVYDTTAIVLVSRGIFSGGKIEGFDIVNTIDYITISTPGDATDFGDLTSIKLYLSATSNGSNDRGVLGGGAFMDFSGAALNTIDYITISTPGDSSDFGDLLAKYWRGAGTSNGTNERGVFGSGSSTGDNVIQYITINSIGNSSDFGDLTVARNDLAATSNGTNERGIFIGGYILGFPSSTWHNTIDYITINSIGDASDFGDLTVAKKGLAATSNGTNERGVFAGGTPGGGVGLNIIEYITISSIGDASDFGDLTGTRQDLASTSNGIEERGIFGGGNGGASGSPVFTNIIEYITINSIGDASDFGDLISKRIFLAATAS